MPSSAFVVGQWVRGGKFYGRAALLDEILEGPRNSIWLLGTRRIGKTSVLKQLEFLTADPEHSRFCPLFWDFQGAEDLEELHEGFVDALWDAEDRLDSLGVKPGDLEKLELFESIGRLRRHLRTKDMRLLLLCDEVEELINLSKKNPSLLRKLRRVMQSHEGVRCVIASTIRLWALAEQRGDTSPFLHGFTPPLYIHRLSDDEARALIRQGNLPSESRPQFNEEAEEKIRTRCDNHPYLIQLVCKRFQELGNLDEAVEEVAADPMVNYFFAVDFEMLSAPERSIVRIIAETSAATSNTIHGRIGVEEDSLSGNLLQLEHLGYIRRNAERRFELVNFFFRRWFSRPTRSGDSQGAPMDADRYEQVTRIFVRACKLESDERRRFLGEACGDDAELRAEVESLLAHDGHSLSDLGRRGGGVDESRVGSDEDTTQLASKVTPGLFDGRYDLLKRIGEGATGVVYKAHDRVLDEVLAIKILRSAFSSHTDTIDRFRQEILLARDIVHPNVLKIYHLGDCEGRRYLTMKWISGATLAEVIRDDAPLPIRRSVEIATKLFSAVEAAHSLNVIHRDIKPSNILMDDRGEPILSDFGLGRLLDTPSKTRSGVFLGTPHYASPEQARLVPSDERSDVYSLGVVLFEMLTGERPYPGDTSAEVLEMHRNAPPRDPRETRADIPRELADLVLRCLQKNSQDRFRDGGRLRFALEGLRIDDSC